MCTSPTNRANAATKQRFDRPTVIGLKFIFWLGVSMFLMGTMITFVPGAERNWFASASVQLLAGLFVPRWPYRAASLVLVLLCVGAAIAGHQRGRDYQQKLEQRTVGSCLAPCGEIV